MRTVTAHRIAGAPFPPRWGWRAERRPGPQFPGRGWILHSAVILRRCYALPIAPFRRVWPLTGLVAPVAPNEGGFGRLPFLSARLLRRRAAIPRPLRGQSGRRGRAARPRHIFFRLPPSPAAAGVSHGSPTNDNCGFRPCGLAWVIRFAALPRQAPMSLSPARRIGVAVGDAIFYRLAHSQSTP